MLQHVHPKSGDVIVGMHLPAQTVLMAHDRYSSTRGNWEINPVPGAVLRAEYNGVIWVRPSGDLSTLSPEGKNLLLYLAETGYFVTWSPVHVHWVMIPTPKWRDDRRMDWEVAHPECVDDLIYRGFLLVVHCGGIYGITDAGHKAVRLLSQ